MRINSKCVLLIVGVLSLKIAYAVGLLSLEKEWWDGYFPANVYAEAVYYTNGSDCFKVLSVVPNQGIIAQAVPYTFDSNGRRDVRIFIKGKFNDIADGDVVPKLYMRLDGTWQYGTALGAMSTIKAFKVLPEAERDALLQKIEEKQKAAAKKIHEERIRKVKELGDFCAKNQEMRKSEIAKFLSSLNLDLLDKIYIDPKFAPHMRASITRDVRLEDMIEAQKQKDWDKCLAIIYEEFLLPEAKSYLDDIWMREFLYDGSIPKKLYLDQDIPQKLFSALEELYTSEVNKYTGELLIGYERLCEAQKKNAWGECLNIANKILLSIKHPAAIDIDFSQTLICYPDEHLFKKIIESLMACKFEVYISSCREFRTFSPQTEGAMPKLGEDPKEVEVPEVDSTLSPDIIYNKAAMHICLGGRNFYLCTDRAELEELLKMERGDEEELKNLSAKLENHQIRPKEYSDQKIKITTTCSERMTKFIAKYVSISKWASQEGAAEQICICEAGKDNEITEDKQDGLKTTQRVEGGGRNVTKAQAISGIDANEAKSDKDKFASVWKAIQPTNPKASKEAQRISRLECGMRNATLSRIYEKYTGLSCEDLLDKYLSALDAAKKVSKVNDDGRDKVSVLEEELLELQQEKSELSAGRKTLAMPSPREMQVSKRILQLQSEIKKQKAAKRQYEKNEKKAIAEALNSVEKKFRKKFLSDLSAAMDAIINAK